MKKILFVWLSSLILFAGCSGDDDAASRSLQWFDPLNLTDYISVDGEDAENAEVAIAANGDSVIVWIASDGNFYQVYKSEYRNGTWTHPSSLSDNISPDGVDTSGAQVAMAPNGDTIIVWTSGDGFNDQIYKSEYRNGSWTHPTSSTDNISPDGENAGQASVAMSSNGEAIIVWNQVDGVRAQVFKSEYRNGSWVHPTNIADNISVDNRDAENVNVSMDSSGNTIIVWNQTDSSFVNQIYKSEFRGSTWTHPVDLDDNISSANLDAFNPKVAMDNTGAAIIVWYQNQDVSFNYHVFKSEYRNGAWVHPTNSADHISIEGFNSNRPYMTMSANGQAVIVWSQFDGSQERIFMSEMRDGTWVHPTSITDYISPGTSSAADPRVAMNSTGETLIVWEQYDGLSVDQTFKSEYRNGSWIHPTDLTDFISPAGEDVDNPKVAISSNGQAVIVWEQETGTLLPEHIFKSEYR